MSKKELSVFNFEESTPIRVITIDGEQWFVGKDVCQVLGYTNPAKAMSDHCKGITKRYPLETAGGKQEVRILSEADVMRLICGSKLPAAQKFERWVFEEVLPAIRRTGSYAVPSVPSVPVRESPCSEQPELPLSASRPQPQFLPEAVYRGVPVISLPRLAQQLGVTPNQIHSALHNNRAGLIENTELFRVKGGYALRAAGCGNVFGRRTHLLNLFTESGAAKIRAYLFPDLPVPAPAIAAEPLPQVKAELPLPGLDIPRLTRSRGVITITGADFRRKLAERELDAEKLLRKLSAAGYDVETAMVEVAYLRDLSRRFCDQAEFIRENLLRAESGANRLCNLSLNAVYRFGRGGGIGTGETVFA